MDDYEAFVQRMGSFDMELSTEDIIPETKELNHYGVLGMKWGVRRYQPYPKGEGSKGKFKGKRSQKVTKKEQKKNIGKMSDEQLRSSINRINMENQLLNLTVADKSAGRKFAEGVIKSAGTTVATVYVTAQMNKYGAKAGSIIIDTIKKKVS